MCSITHSLTHRVCGPKDIDIDIDMDFDLLLEAKDFQVAGLSSSVVAVLVVAGVRQQILLGMPGDGEGGRIHRHIGDLLAGLGVGHIDEQILGGGGQQTAIETEGDGAHGPLQTGEYAQTGELIGIPEGDQSVRRSRGKVTTGGIEFYANAGCRMCLQHMLQHQIRVTEYVHTAHAIGEEEQIAAIVPGYLIHLQS